MKWTSLRELSITKTLLFNLYYCSFNEAIKLPFLVGKKVKIGHMGSTDSIKIENLNKRIKIGINSSFGMGSITYWYLSNSAFVIFRGGATIGKGTQVIVNGKLDVGENFFCNANCIINAGKRIEFGNDSLLGWNVTVLDGDGHTMINDGDEIERYTPIKIGNHVWLASHCSVLKGSYILSNSVVAYGAIVSKEYETGSLLIGGHNKILRQNIDWRR